MVITMEYGTIKGINKKVSRYFVGTMSMTSYEPTPEELQRLDRAFEAGMNVLDCAQGYGYPNLGSTEVALGKWINSRGIRDQVVLTTKGCHPNPFRTRVHAYDIDSDLFDSLAKMKTDYIDMYYLHRDDVNTPVSELIDKLNEHIRAGRVLAIGVTNWSYERIKEANEYAKATGQVGFTLSESHYSIAEQLDEPFAPGSGTISGPKYEEARRWYKENDIPVASYSTLSGGFVTGRITRESYKADPESVSRSVRVAYCHDINFTRLERTAILAKEKGVTIAQIGLAYAMTGELDVYPIIGAANIEEIESSIAALDIKLTAAERSWIDLTSDER